jgi:glycine/D-amino acid oxidase-like deaminating enzyme
MNTDGPQRQLVVLGAGIIGLTIGYLAATDPDFSFKVTIVARDMPEDMDSQAWASPFAVRRLLSSAGQHVIVWVTRVQIGHLCQQEA